MNDLKILEWRGRLGNNLMQIRNALHICYFYKVNLHLPFHKFFNTRFIELNKNKTIKFMIDNKNRRNNFRDRKNIKDLKINLKCFEENYDLVLKKIREIFFYPENKYNFNENDLIIHIRGGDILKNNWNPYIPLPISYYKKIIDEKNWENIFLISQNKNYIVDEILKIYPKIIFKIDSLEKDIDKILNISNLVISIGTFTTELILMSNKKYLFTN